VDPSDCKLRTPGGVLPAPSATAWVRGRSTYLLALLACGFAVTLAFIPAVAFWLVHGVWYMNVAKPEVANPFQRLVNAHAISALAMLVLLVAQVATGATGAPGDGRRKYHKWIGQYLLAPLLVICLSLSTAAEIAANLCCQEFSFITMLTTALIFTTFGLGFRAAKLKRYSEHKDWMLWTIVLTSLTGLSRVGMYVAQPFMECDSFKSDWPFFVAALLATITAFVCLRSVGRLKREHRANRALLAIHVLVGCYALLNSLLFECPGEERVAARAA